MHAGQVVGGHGQGIEVFDKWAGRRINGIPAACENNALHCFGVAAVAHRVHEIHERDFALARGDEVHEPAAEGLLDCVAEVRAPGDGHGMRVDLLGQLQGAQGFIGVQGVIFAYAHKIRLPAGNFST